jgi:hypothetical protein
VLMHPDLDPGDSKTYGSYGSGSESATLIQNNLEIKLASGISTF